MPGHVGDDEATILALRRDLQLGDDSPRPRPGIRLIIGDRFETLHVRLAVAIAVIIQLQVRQPRLGAIFQNLVAAVAKSVQQTFALA